MKGERYNIIVDALILIIRNLPSYEPESDYGMGEFDYTIQKLQESKDE